MVEASRFKSRQRKSIQASNIHIQLHQYQLVQKGVHREFQGQRLTVFHSSDHNLQINLPVTSYKQTGSITSQHSEESGWFERAG